MIVMALQFIKSPADDDAYVVATARLCKTEDDRLVPDTDPDARWLFCVPGAPIRRADAERYGLLDEPEPTPEPAPEPEPEAKVARTPANKARRPSSNK